MNTAALIDRLESFAEILPVLVRDVKEADARWKPKDRQWSILEIVNHLVDIEVEDMRLRLGLVLQDPGQDWPGINPQQWAIERKYNERDLAESVAAFVSERRISIDFLRSLSDPSWDNAYDHPVLGSMRTGDILSAWAAHDILHTRQICKRLFQLVQRDAQPYRTEYAGTWI